MEDRPGTGDAWGRRVVFCHPKSRGFVENHVGDPSLAVDTAEVIAAGPRKGRPGRRHSSSVDFDLTSSEVLMTGAAALAAGRKSGAVLLHWSRLNAKGC